MDIGQGPESGSLTGDRAARGAPVLADGSNRCAALENRLAGLAGELSSLEQILEFEDETDLGPATVLRIHQRIHETQVAISSTSRTY